MEKIKDKWSLRRGDKVKYSDEVWIVKAVYGEDFGDNFQVEILREIDEGISGIRPTVVSISELERIG